MGGGKHQSEHDYLMTGAVKTLDVQEKSNHMQTEKHLLIFLLTFDSKVVLKTHFQEEELKNAKNLVYAMIGKAGTRKFRKTRKSVSKPLNVPCLSSICHKA